MRCWNQQLDELSARQPTSDAKSLAKELLGRGWLTAYQANLLLQDRAAELVLGSYLLLERLGQGGMGAVFKARHRTLDRLVALKLIRKERLANPDAVKRFRREIRAAAQLNHPNIVLAFDADEAHGTHFFTMEYVEGVDLHRWVKQHHAMPIDEACNCIRQAALGLQHAHECGLVHRDIKPSNLLLTRPHAPLITVKILDMGLARLGVSDAADEATSTLTQEGAVMGTPDFLAPEQARASHAVDIRADLYSLGCTFYFLLTAKVPFPGGSVFDKMFQHRMEDPVPVEERRPEVPAAVAGVVRKLMAKRPEDRYQTPAEAAAALQEVFRSRCGAVVETPPGAAPLADDLTTSAPADADTVAGLIGSQQQRRQTARRHRLWLNVGGGVVLLGLMGLVASLLLRQTRPGLGVTGPRAVVAEPEPRNLAFEKWLRTVAALPAEKQAEAVGQKLRQLNPRFDGQLTPRIVDGVVTEMSLVADEITDLAPLRALSGLTILKCTGNSSGKAQLADLGPLRGMPLTHLEFSYTQVADLEPLRGMPLHMLDCAATRVADLGPLDGMPLSVLYCQVTPVTDLKPLRGMKLTALNCGYTKVADLRPLQGMPLTSLDCVGTPVADLGPLRGSQLTSLNCTNTRVTDLGPLRGLPLTSLRCGLLAELDSLSPLEGLALAYLECQHTQVKDLAPLRDMPLKWLDCRATRVSDLGPLQGAPLGVLDCGSTPVADLGPLRGRPLQSLSIPDTRVADLAPLRGMPLTSLNCAGTPVADLEPLRGMKLNELHFGATKVVDLSPLRGLPLTQLSFHATPVADLAPLEGMSLKGLNCNDTRVADLAPLKTTAVTLLSFAGAPVTDLSPLQGLKLTELICGRTAVADLSPLHGMPLTNLVCDATKVAHLGPLRGLPLQRLQIQAARVTDLTPLQGLPLQELTCDFQPGRDTAILKTIKTLAKINGLAVAEFWKEVDSLKSKQP